MYSLLYKITSKYYFKAYIYDGDDANDNDDGDG